VLEEGETLLLVEDEAMIALAELRQLRAAGYRVLHARSGEEAVELFAGDEPGIDLVLMDINLGPGMDGTEAARKILEGRELPIVFLSSHTEKEIVSKTEEISSYGYVVKNSGITVLVASIKMAFKLFRAHGALEAANRELRDRQAEAQASRAALAISEEKFSKAFLMNPDAILIARPADGVIIDINRSFTDILGYSPEEAVSHSTLKGDLDLWVDLEERSRLVSRLECSGEVTDAQTFMRRKDGTVFPVLLSARRIDIFGEPCVMSTIRDITVQRQAEKAIKAERDRAGRYLEIAEVALIGLDASGRVSLMNRKGAEMLGYGSENLVGKDWFESFVPPEERVVVRGKFMRMMAGEDAGPVRYENDILGKGGSRRRIAWHNAVLRDDEGAIVGTLSSGEDITEQREAAEALRESEANLQALIENTDAAIWSFDRDCRLVNSNARFRERVSKGFGKAIGNGDSLIEGAPDQLKAPWQAYYDRCLSGEAFRIEAMSVPPLEPRLSEYRFNPIEHPGGGIVGCTILTTDITDRMLQEGRMQELLVQKDTLMRELKHRIKNNLGVISSLLELELAKLPDEAASAVFRAAISRIASMAAIYDRLGESGNPTGLDLTSYLNDIAAGIFELYTMAPGRIDLRFSGEPVTIDSSRAVPLGLAVNELVTNALKHGFPGGRSGSISVALETRGKTVRISVSDDGVGLGEGFAIDSSKGVGLMLVRLLVQQVQGSVEPMCRGPGKPGGTSIAISFDR
jgi:PAS domain S-box-containing protein